MEKNKENFYALSGCNIIVISLYYIFLFLLAILICVFVFLWEYQENPPFNMIQLSIIGSATNGLLGSTICYIRKMYLLSIQNRLIHDYCLAEKVGTILYFMIRPLFSMVLTVIIMLGVAVGIFSFFVAGGELTHNFINFSMVVSFFLGISNGKLMDKLNEVGNNFISKLLD